LLHLLSWAHPRNPSSAKRLNGRKLLFAYNLRIKNE
jgi:hypothetical protein